MVRWTRINGDGLVYEGGCTLSHISFMAGDDNRYVDVYDGRDATSGKLFQRYKLLSEETTSVDFSTPVPFDRGIYIDAESSEEKTTVVFQPLSE